MKTGDNTVDMCLSGSLDLPFYYVYKQICRKDVSLEPRNPRFMLRGRVITDFSKTLRQLGLNIGNDGETLELFVLQQPQVNEVNE